MRNIIFATLVCFATALSADQLSPISDAPLFKEALVAKQGFYYVRFAAAENDLSRIDSLVPGLGIGYRRLAGDGAADISINGIGRAESKNGRIFWAAPKATYIRYFAPEAKKSSYVGAGLAWGGVSSRGQSFVGIIPCATVGYEFVRKSAVLGFTELNISQPAISVYHHGAFPGPVAECTVGMGF